jgi:hypothetical protein
MNETGGANVFRELSAATQTQIIAIGQQMARLARDHAIPIIFAPPVSAGGKINGASGCVLQFNNGAFVVTASHVLDGYQERISSGEVLNWQVGDLPPFDPLPRIAWQSRERDIVLLSISANEVSRIGKCIISTPPQWPECSPQVGDMVLAAGYPKALRVQDSSLRTISAGSYSAVFRVTTTGASYCICQVEQQDLISFDGGPLPEPDTDMGGLSGGPVLLVSTLSYPVVGIITQRWQMGLTELVRFATLDNVMIDEVGVPRQR